MSDEKEPKKPKDTRGLHPNSVAALRPYTKGDPRASVHQKMGAEARKRNAARKKIIKEAIRDYSDPELMATVPTAEQVINILMLKALEHGDDDLALDIAKFESEFQRPKQQRITNDISMSIEGATEEEVELFANNVITYDELRSRINKRAGE